MNKKILISSILSVCLILNSFQSIYATQPLNSENEVNDLVMEKIQLYDKDDNLIAETTRDINTEKINQNNSITLINNEEYKIKCTVYTTNNITDDETTSNDSIYQVNSDNEDYVYKCKIKSNNFIDNRKVFEKEFKVNKYESCIFSITGQINNLHYIPISNENKNNDTLSINAEVIVEDNNENYEVNPIVQVFSGISTYANNTKNMIMMGLGLFNKDGELINKTVRDINNDSVTLTNKGLEYHNLEETVENEEEYILRSYLYSTTNNDVTGIVKKIALTEAKSLVLLKNNELYQVDNNTHNLEKVAIDNVVDVAAGRNHVLILNSNGQVYAFGDNTYGQLGKGNYNYQANPVRIYGLPTAKTVYANGNSSYILTNNQDVYAFGDNTYGQLGLGHNNAVLSAKRVNISKVKSIGAGENHVIYVKANGDIYGSGKNSNMQLGLGNNKDVNVPTKINISKVKKAAASKYHTIILLENGTVYGMGLNSYGQLGNGSFSDKDQPTKTDISGVKDIAVSYNKTILLTEDNKIHYCGENLKSLSAILGDEQSYPYNIPVESKKGQAIRALDILDDRLLVLFENGQVYMYSDEQYYELKISEGTLQQKGEILSNSQYLKLRETYAQYDETNNNAIAKNSDNNNYIYSVQPKDLLADRSLVTVDTKIKFSQENIDDIYVSSSISDSINKIYNSNLEDDSLGLKVNVNPLNDLILTKLSIYDDQTTSDEDDDILLYSAIRDIETGEISYSSEEEIKLANNKTYRVETEVYNKGKLSTFLNPAQVSLQFLYGNNYIKPTENQKWYANKINKAIEGNSYEKFNWQLFIDSSKKGKLSIHSMVHKNHYIVNDNTSMKNDLLSLNLAVYKDEGDIKAEDVYLIDPNTEERIDNIKMGNEYKVRYTASYDGPTQYYYTYIGNDTVTNSPQYKRELQSFYINLKGDIQTSVPEDGKVGYIKINLNQLADTKNSNGGVYLIENGKLEFTTKAYAFIEAMYTTDANIVINHVPDSNIEINKIKNNNLYSKKHIEEYDIIVKNFRLIPINETPKDLNKVYVLARYDLEYNVPSELNYDQLIISKTKIILNKQEYIFEDPLFVKANDGENTLSFSRVLEVDISSIRPDYKGNERKLLASINTNFDRANYEYTKDGNYIANNKSAQNGNNREGLSLLKTDYSILPDINSINRYAEGTYVNVENKTMVLAPNNKKYPIYTYKDSINSNNQYKESYKITKVLFRSKYTEENYKEVGADKDGWLELKDTTNGIIKAGYGYDLKVQVTYKNNFNPLSTYDKLGSTIDTLKPNIPGDIVAEYKTDEDKDEKDSRYTVLGIDSNKVFDVKTIESKNEIIYEFTTSKKIYTDKNAKDGETELCIRTPIINAINYGNDERQLGDMKKYTIEIKGSYLDDVTDHLDY